MEEFIAKTLMVEYFWIALSAVVTTLALITALCMPGINGFRKNNTIERLIRKEIEANMPKVRNIRNQPVNVPGVGQITALQNNNALVEHIDLRIWEQYKYELATQRPKSFEKYQAVNCTIENILRAPLDPLKMAVQFDSAQTCIQAYDERFGKST